MSLLTGITRPYDAGFFTGTSSGAAQVGSIYDIAIGGRGYMLDLIPEGGGNGYEIKSLPLLQRYFLTQQTGDIGEQTLNPLDYWRRSVDDWTHGSGQLYNDRDGSSIRDRFRTSKGIDCWTPGQITLLNDTTQILTSANTNLALAVAGGDLYIMDGTALKFTPDGSTYTTTTGTALSSGASLASDGFTVWASDTVDTYYTQRGGSSHSLYFASPRPGNLVRSVKGRLFVANGATIYTASGNAGSATATAFYTHPNSDWTWVDITEGPTAIYFAGFSGDKSIIYQTAVVSDGTNLAIPSAAATLPSGEIVRSITGYLGVMMIGTDLGVRVAAIDSQGNLTVGDLIHTSSSVRCFEPQSHFVWFGWTNYDGVSTGLGRVDLGTFNNSAPAYASDIMATVQGTVGSVVTFQGVPTYAVQGSGVWQQHATNKVASGVITSGQLLYELPDNKIAIKYDVSFLNGAGTITAALSPDMGPFVQIGTPITTTNTAGGTSVQTTNQVSGRSHEIQLTLARGADTTQAPIITRWTLLANPAPTRRAQIIVALLLHEQTQDRMGQTLLVDTLFERNQIDAWLQSNQVLTFQDTEAAYSVTVNDYEWRSDKNVDRKRKVWDGTEIVTLNIIN